MVGAWYFVPYVPLYKGRHHCYDIPCKHPHRGKKPDSPHKVTGEEAREIVRMLRRARQSEFEREVYMHQAWYDDYQKHLHRDMGDYGMWLAMLGDEERARNEVFHEFDLMKRRMKLKKEKEQEKKGQKGKGAGEGDVYRVKKAIYVHVDE